MDGPDGWIFNKGMSRKIVITLLEMNADRGLLSKRLHHHNDGHNARAIPPYQSNMSSHPLKYP